MSVFFVTSRPLAGHVRGKKTVLAKDVRNSGHQSDRSNHSLLLVVDQKEEILTQEHDSVSGKCWEDFWSWVFANEKSKTYNCILIQLQICCPSDCQLISINMQPLQCQCQQKPWTWVNKSVIVRGTAKLYWRRKILLWIKWLIVLFVDSWQLTVVISFYNVNFLHLSYSLF